MPGSRYDLILASSALALILAVPLSGMANDPSKLAPAPMAVTLGEQASTQTSTMIAIPAKEVSNDTLADPASATDQAAMTDPLASLDPADRAIAETLRDLLATKLDKLFSSK